MQSVIIARCLLKFATLYYKLSLLGVVVVVVEVVVVIVVVVVVAVVVVIVVVVVVALVVVVVVEVVITAIRIKSSALGLHLMHRYHSYRIVSLNVPGTGT